MIAHLCQKEVKAVTLAFLYKSPKDKLFLQYLNQKKLPVLRFNVAFSHKSSVTEWTSSCLLVWLQERQEQLAAFLTNAPDFTPRTLRITPTSNFLLFFLMSMFFLPCVLTHLFYVYVLWRAALDIFENKPDELITY